MRRAFLGVTAILIFLFGITGVSQATGKTNLMLIFDTSGSMWGQIDGKAKITIAKEAMDLIVNDLPADMNVGLVAYGHRRKGDCDDVETLIPIGPLNAKQFLVKINALNPKGKTPMVRSIKKTADSIKHLEDETTILLVSDGEETCDPDPCGFVAELEKLGIKFTLHVVGFDVGGKTEAQLKCMAKAGGGEYFPAKDAGKLKEALDTVIEKTVEKNLKVSVFLNGKPIGGSVEVINPKTNERVGYRSSSQKRAILLSVKPGTYTLNVVDEWQQEGRPALIFDNVQISDSEVREVTANFGSGILKIWSIRNGKSFKGSALVTDIGGKTMGGGWKTTYPDKAAVYKLQPGKYKVVVEDSWGAGTKKDLGIIEMAAGQTFEKKVSFDTGKLVIWTQKNGKPFKGSVRVADRNDRTMDGGWGTTYENKPKTYVLEPGIYSVVAEDSWGDPVVKFKFGYVDIKPGHTLNKICDFDSPPSQNQAPPAPPATVPGSTSSSSQATPQAATAGSLKQTDRETVAQASAPVVQNPQDMQTMAAQMQSAAQARAAKARADAMAQMQAALAEMQGTQKPQADTSGQTTSSTAGGRQTDINENPRDIALPKVVDSQAGYSIQQPTADDHGAQPQPQVGAPMTDADIEAKIAAMEARDTGGGLDDIDERPEQGHNPYAGMSTQEMQAAFAKDMGMQGPQGAAYDKTKWQLSAKGWPLQCGRYEDTLNNRLDTYKEQAESIGRSDIIARIDTARTNLKKLAKLRKKRAPVDMVQQTLDQCVQENHAIKVTLMQAQ